MASPITKRPVRRAAIAGAIAFGTIIIPAAPALAAPVTVPGVGTFDIPGLPENMLNPGAPSFTTPMATAGDRAVSAAESKIGSPYVYGASGPDAFDCSGLVQWAFRQAGVQLPRTSYDQATVGTPVSLSTLRAGDIVTFYGGEHAGIYIGDGKVVHAATTGTPVKVAPMNSMPVFAARRV